MKSGYFETKQTVIQSKPTAEFSFGLTVGSFWQLNGKELNDFIKNSEGTEIIKLSSQYLPTCQNFV